MAACELAGWLWWITPIPPSSYAVFVSTTPHFEVQRTYRHSDGHLALGDGVHRATHERGLEHDVTRDLRLRHDFLGRKVDFAWQEQEVVVGETTVLLRVHELLDRQAIRPRVRRKMLEGFLRVHELSRRHDGKNEAAGAQEVVGSKLRVCN